MIDRNRGCMIKHHRSGMRIVMYYDEPGVYYDERGGEVTAELAKTVGFDVDRHLVDSRKQSIRRRLEEMLEQVEDRGAELVEQIASGGGDIQVRKTPNGGYHVYDSEGERLSKVDMPEEEAKVLFEAATGRSWSKAKGGGKGSGQGKKASGQGKKASESASETAETGSEGDSQPGETAETGAQDGSDLV